MRCSYLGSEREKDTQYWVSRWEGTEGHLRACRASLDFALITFKGTIFSTKKISGEPLYRENLEGCSWLLPLYRSHVNMGAELGGHRVTRLEPTLPSGAPGRASTVIW